MKITVDCDISAALSHLPSGSSLAYLLAKGQVEQVGQVDFPLEALICQQFGLSSNPDFPIAAIAAATDGLDVGEAYWLRADPVHLALQRDCFSLAEPVPLAVAIPHAERVIDSLNQHFSQDGLTFCLGKSGAWYLRCNTTAKIKTSLPALALDKNIHPFLPTGAEASKWTALLNEVQMLLHEHPANQARETTGEVAINSIWLSGGGIAPQHAAQLHDADLIVANGALHRGLAAWANVPIQAPPSNLTEILHSTFQQVRLQLPQLNNLDEAWIKPLLQALKSNKVKQLTINLGFYESCITLHIKPMDCYKFWRTPKPVMEYLK